MAIGLGILIFVGTIVAMEGFAYVMHRWVMHGPGWFLHRSHHQPRRGTFELNYIYGIIFAIPSIILIYGGVQLDWGSIAVVIGTGIAGYGAIYFGFHDVIVHKRLNMRFIPKSFYLKRIVQAHRLHHVVEAKDGAISFGFILAPRPERLKAQLTAAENERFRTPGKRP